MKIEVIMSAYNNVRDLKLVLDGYVIQSDQDFSICIADDGLKWSSKIGHRFVFIIKSTF